MTDTLYIRPPKDSAGLRIYAPQGDAGAGQADANAACKSCQFTQFLCFFMLKNQEP